mmetsp:Transcript_123019/g.355532  ORF Transcript_123019/g.355532 Transcript_123019/m.355532 type:complete len:97 (+) Transcript_123019:179-469(+)
MHDKHAVIYLVLDDLDLINRVRGLRRVAACLYKLQVRKTCAIIKFPSDNMRWSDSFSSWRTSATTRKQFAATKWSNTLTNWPAPTFWHQSMKQLAQ